MLKEYSWKDIKELRILGRTDLSHDFLPLLFNGSAVEVCVDGSELWVDLDVNCAMHEPWIYTELNGSFMSRQMLLPGQQSLCLFRSMDSSKKKTFKLAREIQAMHEDTDCHIYIKGFRTDGSFYPLKPYDYKLEFIGDSITSGEGSYGARDDYDWLAMYMSFSRTYANIVCKALNADYRVFSQGGFGVFCGWDNNPESNIPMYYDKLCGLWFGDEGERIGAQKDYNFSEWIPDAVIINLGTNDDTAFDQPAFTDPVSGKAYRQRRNDDNTFNIEDIDAVKKAIISFIKNIRSHYKSAHIVWAYGMLGYDFNFVITDAMNTYIRETGDNNVAFLNLPDTTDKTVGSHGHPGYESHIRAAGVLSDYLSKVLQGDIIV